jgi:hypothetical protein
MDYDIRQKHNKLTNCDYCNTTFNDTNKKCLHHDHVMQVVIITHIINIVLLLLSLRF